MPHSSNNSSHESKASSRSKKLEARATSTSQKRSQKQDPEAGARSRSRSRSQKSGNPPTSSLRTEISQPFPMPQPFPIAHLSSFPLVWPLVQIHEILLTTKLRLVCITPGVTFRSWEDLGPRIQHIAAEAPAIKPHAKIGEIVLTSRTLNRTHVYASTSCSVRVSGEYADLWRAGLSEAALEGVIARYHRLCRTDIPVAVVEGAPWRLIDGYCAIQAAAVLVGARQTLGCRARCKGLHSRV